MSGLDETLYSAPPLRPPLLGAMNGDAAKQVLLKRKVAWRKDIGRYRYVGTDSDALGGQTIDGGVSLGQAERKRLLEMYRRSPVPAVRPREDHGWRLRLGQAMDGDTIIQHRSKAVLVLDSAVAGGLADRTLDLKRTDKGARLHLQRRPA